MPTILNSEILVNAGIEGDKVIVSVKDTGKGMGEEDSRRLKKRHRASSYA